MPLNKNQTNKIGIWDRKMCHTHNEKWEKPMDGIELPNQESIETLGEKENKKYSGILKAGTIKQTAIKEKVRKVYSNSKLNSTTEISS